jgi:2-polyprenyl-3-methyl-5-hydroxy-6-metoxy-1,4-benzoquinol methylase
MPLNQLPYDIEAHLRPIGEFYICTDFNEDVVRPPVTRIGENIYYRFMNFLYLPQPPESLSSDKVIEICDLRLKYLKELVNYEHNSHIVAAIADYVTSILPNVNSNVNKMKALDFGCGSGLSSKLILEHFPYLDMVGVDISEKAVQRSNEQDLTAILTYPNELLPFEAASFDLIFAIFVMHFSIDMATLAELCRILRPSGKFVFNLYQRDIDGVEQQLIEAGFSTVEVVSDLLAAGTNHLIVSCGTLLPHKKAFH